MLVAYLKFYSIYSWTMYFPYDIYDITNIYYLSIKKTFVSNM